MPLLPRRSTGRKSGPEAAVRTTVVVLFCAWFVDYADRLLINYVLPDLGDEFGLSHASQGLVVSAFFVAYAASQIPGGLLADRFGARPVVLGALIAWSVFTGFTALAWSFGSLLVIRFVFGLAQGVFPAASMKALAERTPADARMTANGRVMSSNATAALAVPLLAAPVIAGLGWRWSFACAAVLGVLVLGLLGRGLRPVDTAPDKAPQETKEAAGASAVRGMVRQPAVWMFATMMFGYNVIMWGLLTWVPSYLKEEAGLNLTTVGLLMAVPAAASVAGTLLGGRWSDRLGGQHQRIMLPAMAVGAACLILMAFVPGLVAFVVLATVAVLAISLTYMPIYAVPMRALPREHTGTGTGIITFGGQVAGMVAPPVLGLLADTLSFRTAFAFLSVGAVIAVLAALRTPRDTPSFLAALRPAAPAPHPAAATTLETETS
ncbi:MFS transporter [Streptomyces sp. SID5785]|uniref:MFS transporter n=1 Tax=Streptomyces sp. SID5785 TaxID=2690309 RepID=UPI001361F05B|nr:MFS transporter [Streptomyces sp. SID5785]MZD04871.1 MFS transporter [Streptomyces sp. SID5785]